MSGSPAAARFRLRMEDGSEVLVSSVEALARRVQRGDLRPDTPLFDGSTGVWSRAGDAPVVQFILEDLQSNGGPPPPDWAEVSPPPAGEAQTLVEFDSILALSTPSPSRPSGQESDPLDFGITLAAPPPEAESSTESEPTPADGPSLPEPPAKVHEDSRRWMTHPGADVLIPARPSDIPPPVEAWEEESPIEELHRPRSPSRPPGGSPTVAPVEHSGGRTSRLRPALLSLIGVALLGAVWVFLRGPADPAADTDFLPISEGTGSPSTIPSIAAMVAAQAPPPPDLAPVVDSVLASFSVAVQVAVDSLRAIHGVEGAPPPQWLSGPYLADAGTLPEARVFWERYRLVVSDLQALDREIFLAVVGQAAEGMRELRPNDMARLEAYFAGRYSAVAPLRTERMEQLAEAATAAISLHDFLVRAAPSLRFTPALGSAVPRDPVLEVGTDDPAVRSELNAHLDDLFRALDRSRGGGALSQGGLRADLFLEFGAL